MKRFAIAIVLLLITIPLVIPFLSHGYFVTHDGNWAVIRLVEMNREIKDLQIPPRWAGFLNHGYGYPLFHFTYPFPYYLGELFHIIGFGFVDSIKLVFVVSSLLSAVFMFLLGRKWWGNWGGLLSAFFYLYAPFRLIDIFIRGSIGESLSFALFPLLFLLAEYVVEKNSRRWIALFAISLAILLLTHNVFALLFSPLLGLYICYLIWKHKGSWQKNSIRLGFSVMLGTLLSSYFLIPALTEQRYTVLSSGVLTQVSDRFIPLTQLFAVSIPALSLPVYISPVLAVGFVAGLIVMFFSKQKVLAGLFGIAALVIVILMMPISSMLWSYLPLFSSIDFSWRLLGPLVFLLSLGAGALGLVRLRFLVVPLLCILLFISIRPLTVPQALSSFTDTYYETNDATTTAFDELMPIWVVDKARNLPAEKVAVVEGTGTIQVVKNKSQQVLFTTQFAEDGAVEINTLYFPGWNVWTDGNKQIPHIQEQRGTMVVSVPAGLHTIVARFINTPIRNIADSITLTAFGTVIVLLLPYVQKRKKQ